MKKNSKLLLTALAMLTLGLSACNPTQRGTNYEYNNKLVLAVELSSTSEECAIGDSFQLIPTITYRDDQVVEVTQIWKSSKVAVATVTQDGFVDVVGNGTTYITFRAGNKQAYCKVFVPSSEPEPEPGPGPVDPDTLTISLSVSSRTLNFGASFNLTATPNKEVSELVFSSEDASIAHVVQGSTSKVGSGYVCEIQAGNAAGEVDIVATSGNATAKCHITVVDDEDPEDLEYTVYFYIDYNNVDPNDDTKCLAKFKWYEDRPFSESGKVPTVSNSQAMDPAFPFFIGWSTHPIIDTKENLWDMNKNTIADLPMVSYSVILYGQWMDVQVLPA